MMAVIKIEHLGIAVNDTKTSNELFSRLLGQDPYKSEAVASEGVNTSFFSIGETKIELLEGIGETGPIQKFLDKKGEGFHHIAFLVDDIHQEMSRLQEEGFQFIYDQPKEGADNKLVAFIHPKSANGVLVELCQEKSA